MSKLLKTLFLILVVVVIGGIGYVSITDVSVDQTPVKQTVTYDDFKAKNQS